MKRVRSAAGITIPEVLIALVVAMLVAVASFALVSAAEQAASVMPAQVEVQQGLRVGVEALARDIGAAGAGLDGGAARGPLLWSLAPIVPRRLGLVSPDPVTAAQPDVVTLITVPLSTPQTSTAGTFGPGNNLMLAGGGACPASQPMCGIAPGTDAIVFDRIGAFDLLTVVDSSGGVISHGSSGHVYDPGSPVSPVTSMTYYFDAATHQLRQYDGYQTDVPLIDDVVRVTFEYLGSPDPPSRPQPPSGVGNCLYDGAGVLTARPALAPTDGALAVMPLSMLSDGPWCGSGATAYDADLLRLRAVRVTLRVEASSAGARGAGVGFLQPGLARDAWRLVRDAEVTFVVRPRNLRP
jgi:hypothetical protein